MNTVELRLKVLSPFRIPLRAPTLFGHIAWVIRDQQGDEALLAWLESFKEQPPVRLSSAFPTGFLPRPLLPTSEVSDTQTRKSLKKLRHVPVELFQEVCRSGDAVLTDYIKQHSEQPHWQSSSRTRVSIDRSSGTALQGALYDTELLWFYSPKTLPQTLSLYMRGDAGSIAAMSELIEIVGQLGYGGGSSIGMGHFAITDSRTVTLPEAAEPTHSVTLAPTLPQAKQQGYWKLETYWGRLGGSYASSRKPFKPPYLRITEGSTLPLNQQGGLLELALDGKAESPRVVEYLWAFPLGVRLT